MKRQILYFGILSLVAAQFLGCNGKFDKVPESMFIGNWQLDGRSVFNGMIIKIELENEKLIGRISQQNENNWKTNHFNNRGSWKY